MYNSGEGFILTLHLNYILFYSYVCSSYKQCLYWYVCAYCSGVFNWYVFASYNGVYIVMFVNLVQYNCCSYFILVTFSYVSPMYGLFFHFIFIKFTFVLIWLWILYLWLLQYVCVIHTILSLVALHLGDIVMHISCLLIVVTLFPSLLTYIRNSLLTHIFLKLVVTCIESHIFVHGCSISHIFISIIKFSVDFYS